MSRPSVMLMSVAAVALLGIGVVLWRSTRSDAVPLARPAAQTEVAAPSPVTAAPGAATAPTTAAREVKRAAPSSAPVSAPPAPRLEPAPSREPDPNAFSPDNPTNLHFGAIQLQQQTRAVEPLVRECVDKAMLAGKHPSGTAMLTYTVVKHKEGVTVDETGVDSEKTTLDDPGLLACLHETAKAMKFEGLPRNATEIFAARSVTIEDGKITEYKHATFSYKPR